MGRADLIGVVRSGVIEGGHDSMGVALGTGRFVRAEMVEPHACAFLADAQGIGLHLLKKRVIGLRR
ncbi:hypothetical protein SDC9_190934 [bioreactor metagenome]|uniref:Uncharacterized protein n=1 Tax=bioreactor metagenome TaxID=1076179 RepID=A0A645HWD9_9ZZZZ